MRQVKTLDFLAKDCSKHIPVKENIEVNREGGSIQEGITKNTEKASILEAPRIKYHAGIEQYLSLVNTLKLKLSLIL